MTKLYSMTDEEIKEKAKTDFDLKIQSCFFLWRNENVYLNELVKLYKTENSELKKKFDKIYKSINKAKKQVSFYEHLKFVSEHHKIANEIKKELPKIFKQLKSK